MGQRKEEMTPAFFSLGRFRKPRPRERLKPVTPQGSRLDLSPYLNCQKTADVDCRPITETAPRVNPCNERELQPSSCVVRLLHVIRSTTTV